MYHFFANIACDFFGGRIGGFSSVCNVMASSFDGATDK